MARATQVNPKVSQSSQSVKSQHRPSAGIEAIRESWAASTHDTNVGYSTGDKQK